MIKINCIENTIDAQNNHFSKFIIEPLEIGQSVTLGNTLRRIMLNELLSFGILFVKVNNLVSEFSAIPGLREDLYELLFNLKEIVFKELLIKNDYPSQIKGYINITGPLIVTTGNIKISNPIIEVTNSNQYIGTLLDSSSLYLELFIGKTLDLNSYLLKKEPKRKQDILKTHQGKFNVSSLYNPIKFINYNSKIIYDINGNIKESLILEIMTNGSKTPKRCIQEALKKALDLYSNMFFNLNEEFLKQLLTNKI